MGVAHFHCATATLLPGCSVMLHITVHLHIVAAYNWWMENILNLY